MDEKYIWHFNDEEYMQWAEAQIIAFEAEFDYKDYITPHDDARELIGRILEEFQLLESCIKSLLKCAVETGIYVGKATFNFDKFIQATRIINELKGILFEEKSAEDLIELIRFRNYIVHFHYVSDDQKKAEKLFPHFLFMIINAVDYVSNVMNRIIGGCTHLPNVFELKTKNISFSVPKRH